MPKPDIEDVRERFIAQPGQPFDLSARDSGDRELFPDKSATKDWLGDDAEAIDELQDRLYAVRDRALLVVLQGMDTSGKSGVIRHVFADTSPLGMQIKAFKAPSDEELAHDYLWRVHEAVPRKGFIGIFDRSHYEDVLVVKVRDFAPAEAVEQRYEQINQFEKYLTENGVTILKFMLHIGYEKQEERLKERIIEAHKRWKFNPNDLDDRKLWPEFMEAYETMVQRCSTEWAPWYIIPADSRPRRNAAIARVIRGTLEDMDLEWPDPGYSLDDFDFS
jgi:PPK2 family polyphosphate:nucleotide phosphotransferase